MTRTLRALLAAATLLMASATTLAGELTGMVVGVSDGDTLTLLVDGQQRYRVRLGGIDAPEKHQPYGERSKQRLAELTFNRLVRVEFHKRDRYRRLVGKVLLNDSDINQRMLEAGLAWHYEKYASEQSAADRAAYAKAAQRARNAQLGLWRDPHPVPPWRFRRHVW